MRGLSLLVLSACTACCLSLKVASFNIKWFSESKVNNPGIFDILRKIIDRYDIVEIVEVRNVLAVKDLATKLNSLSSSQLGYIYSDKEGTTTYKEEYAFLYRKDKVSVQGHYQFTDPHNQFERDPYGVHFHVPSTSVKDFVMVAIHTKPAHAAEEIGALDSAAQVIASHLNQQNILIAGDFNAACHYFSNTAMHHNLLYNDPKFTWLISNTEDTTTSTRTHCAYDRFVVGGSAMKASVVAGSAKAFNYQKAYSLPFNEAWDVSDHYPIEVELK